MERNYLEDFPIDDTEHKIVGGKSDYVNKFFHEIDLKYILERLDQVSADDISLTNDGLSVKLLDNGEVKSTINLSQPVNGAIDEAKTALQSEINLVKGRVSVLEASMSTAEDDIDDLQANVNGFRYFPAGTDLVGLVADDSIYTDANGLYVLADSTTGETLLADSTTYKQVDSVEDTHGKVGADTCSPFKGGGGVQPFNKIWVPSKDDIMFHVGSKCDANCFGKVYEYDMSVGGTGGLGARIQLQGNTKYTSGTSSRASVTNAVLAYVKVNLTNFTHFFFHTKRTSTSGKMYAFISDVDPATLESISGDDDSDRWAYNFSDTSLWYYYERNVTTWNGEYYVGIAVSASSNEATAIYNFEFFNFENIANISQE